MNYKAIPSVVSSTFKACKSEVVLVASVKITR